MATTRDSIRELTRESIRDDPWPPRGQVTELVTELVTEGDQREMRGRSEGDAHRLGFVIALDAPTTERLTPVPDEGGHQRSLEAVRGHQRSSEVIRGH